LLRPTPPEPTKGRRGACSADGGRSPTPRRRLPEGRSRQPPRKTRRTWSSPPGLWPKTSIREVPRTEIHFSATPHYESLHHTMSPPRRTAKEIPLSGLEEHRLLRRARRLPAHKSARVGSVDELLDVAVERPFLDQPQVEVGRTPRSCRGGPSTQLWREERRGSTTKMTSSTTSPTTPPAIVPSTAGEVVRTRS
jgi:hypothetical protein